MTDPKGNFKVLSIFSWVFELIAARFRDVILTLSCACTSLHEYERKKRAKEGKKKKRMNKRKIGKKKVRKEGKKRKKERKKKEE